MSSIISALRKALEACPSNWETRLALAEAYARDGLKNEAASLLNQAEIPGSDDVDGLIAAARCHALAGSPHARTILDPAFASNPGNARVHLALAFIAHREGDTPTATRHYITATSLDAALSDHDPELAAAYGSILPKGTNRRPEAEAETEVVSEELESEVAIDAVEEEDANHSPMLVTMADEVAADGEIQEQPGCDDDETVTPVAVTTIKRLVNPKSRPKTPLPNVPAPEPGAPAHATAKLIPVSLTNVYVEPHEHERVLYDYKHPDESLFEPDKEPNAGLTVEGSPVDPAGESVRMHQEESERQRRRSVRRDKLQSALVTAAVHAGILMLLTVIVISVPMAPAPQIVAIASPTPPVDTLEKKKVLMPTQRANVSSSSYRPNIVSALAVSDFAVPTVDSQDFQENAIIGTGMNPSPNIGFQGSDGQSFLFGEPIEGTKLGVILDVSGSMAEFLPKVIREVDRNFDKASIVFVNHTRLRSTDPVSTEIRPILTDEVVPYYKEDRTHRTPYWFLWGDLPRKADQAAVDRLITLFKERPNSYLAVGGYNRVAGAMDFLRGLGVDALYVFSDFEDFVDEEAAVESSRKLSKAGIKVYVQPAQERTQYLEIMTRKIADRTKGKELQPLIASTIVEVEPEPLLKEVMDPIKVEVEGVNYATARPDRYGKTYYDLPATVKGSAEISVYEHKNFDLVLYGPYARAEIFLKSEEGYISRPINFRYHSQKWLVDDKGEWYWRQRKWLRNREPPVLEGNEILWKMVLEDELNFDVWFRFDDNSFMATYSADLSNEERGDAASIGFHIPPLAREQKDMYYSADFPQGLNLDRLREATKPNLVVWNLSTKEASRYASQWELYGWQRGKNPRTFDMLCKALPNGILEAVVSGQAFGPRVLHVAPKQNDLLLRSWGYRADIELWEGFSFNLHRPADQTRHRLTKTEAFELTIE